MTVRVSWIDRLQLWASTDIRHDGLTISVLELRDDVAALVSRVREALDLLERYDPRCYRRLKRDCQRIWLKVLLGASAEYHAGLKAILLDQRFVLSAASPSFIAAALVHEATHARLTACGISYAEPSRARVERLCFRQEVAFAQLLPDSPALLEWLGPFDALPGSTWDNEMVRAVALRRAVPALRYAGAPNWLAHLVVWSARISRWLRRRRAA